MAEKMACSHFHAKEISQHLLKQMLQFLPQDKKHDFILQLPFDWQENFGHHSPALKVDPLTADLLTASLMRTFNLTKTDSQNVMRYFWLGLEDCIDHRTLNDILSYFPHDLKIAFGGFETEDEIRLGGRKL
ncbi:MAG: hypothetical protein ACAH59_08915 [Pseudobdellovibrionaceae bacterium]